MFFCEGAPVPDWERLGPLVSSACRVTELGGRARAGAPEAVMRARVWAAERVSGAAATTWVF